MLVSRDAKTEKTESYSRREKNTPLAMYCFQSDTTTKLSQRAKTDKTVRHCQKGFTHKEKPDRMIHDPAEEQVKQTTVGP